MVRNYKKKTDRANWSEEQMKLGILAVEKKEQSIRKAAVVFGVPKDSLNRRVKGKLKSLSTNERYKNVLVVDCGPCCYTERAHMQCSLFGSLPVGETTSTRSYIAEVLRTSSAIIPDLCSKYSCRTGTMVRCRTYNHGDSFTHG